ncbi:MAG TPA: hypothetical protein VKK79_08350 [Candidatus Lokiarchaeia archaeon]|nr:hypothetical protein [Candidatus Lokiarchaeia archaeon]
MTQELVIPENSKLCPRGIMKLWILDREAGICLFEQAFAEFSSELDSDLLGGFLTAISKFYKEFVGEGVHAIDTPSMRMLFKESETEKFTVVILFQNWVNKTIAEAAIEEVSRLFQEKYAQYINEGKLANVSVFQDFAAEIETRFNHKSVCSIFPLLNRWARKKRPASNAYKLLMQLIQK